MGPRRETAPASARGRARGPCAQGRDRSALGWSTCARIASRLTNVSRWNGSGRGVGGGLGRDPAARDARHAGQPATTSPATIARSCRPLRELRQAVLARWWRRDLRTAEPLRPSRAICAPSTPSRPSTVARRRESDLGTNPAAGRWVGQMATLPCRDHVASPALDGRPTADDLGCAYACG